MDMTLSRKAIREALDTTPIETILGVSDRALTPKQKKFAKEVAKGSTKADAYRKAYKADASQHTLASKPYELMRDERIQAEIKAYELALASAEYRQPAQLKALLIQQLVQHSLDPDFPPAQKVQCLRLIGSLYDVAAFEERKTVTQITNSVDAREKVMHELRALMNQDATDATVIDAESLLAELHPLVGATSVEEESRAELHTTPLEQIPPLSDPTPSSEEDPPVAE
jgi:hypothetical protein